ncbi:hypothetical protein Pan44_21810 [Caulifigura coniformis]|uniref:ABC transmembrane type-1 domain-containing protein n=1 Tax=Caulifigura coniformis TaxID=2527983 RepID=A0A517SDF0_9PLAN|nr:hypothetical protein [Caulifigura coniformis]QDT54154.1 hypothetical protein Pan44_21810 [Caulifigura coniformis]
MTYAGAIGASTLRSALVVVVGLVLASLLAEWFRSTESRSLRKIQFVLLAAVFLTPNLIVGFGYRTLSINLLNHRWLNELLYFLLICFECVPAALWLLLYSPPPALSPEAWHCARLARQAGSPLQSLTWRLRFWWKGAGETLVGPAALLFVLSFQESELAALMQVAGWPERLFTDHVGGLPPSETARLVLWPVLIQLPVAVPLLTRIGVAISTPPLSVLSEKSRPGRRRGAALNLFGWTWILAGLAFVIGRPLWHLVDGVSRVSRTVQLQPRWWRELGDAVLLAASCVALTWGAAWLLQCVSRSRATLITGGAIRERIRLGMLSLLLAPGLTGTLALGLLTAGFFQRCLPGLAYTPAPLIVAECLWLWPRVVLVRGSIAARTRVASHQIRLLDRSPDGRQRAGAAAVWWRVAGRPLAGGVCLVAWWSYLEVMLPMILRLPGFDPSPMMMYNHLHYAQVEALGVKLAMILSVPLVLGALVAATVRLLEGRRTT